MLKKICQTCKKEYLIKNCRKNTSHFCSRKCVRFTEEAKYKMGNSNRGIPHTKEWKEKASLSKLNEKNPMWKGNKAGLDAIHVWVLRNKPKPKLCENCKKTPPKDLANISQKYKRDINDFEWLCRKCHMTKDGRIKNLK